MSPQPLSTVDLLARVSTMPVGRRTAFLSAYAREHGDAESFSLLLTELADDGPFAAGLSLFLARIAGDRGHVRAMVGHDECETAVYAVRTAALLSGCDDALGRAVLEGALQVRLAAYKALRVNRCESLADRLLPLVRERFGDREAARLLSACSGPVAAETITDLAYAVTGWAALARRHPGVFADYAHRSLIELPQSQWKQWWEHHREGVKPAVEASPEAWLPLFDRHWVDEPLSDIVGTVLSRLLTADPDGTWRFVLAPEHEALAEQVRSRRGVLRRLARRDTATIAAFMDGGPGVSRMQSLLPLLPPSRREEVVLACGGDRGGVRWYGFAEKLPRALRHEAVRERLAHRKVAESRARREALSAYLPYAEVRGELVDATRRSSATERATAYGRLIRCAGLDGPEAVTDMLGVLDRLGRDQDPVQSVALEALVDVGAHEWRTGHLAPLAELIGAVLNSPWRSGRTNGALLGLASRFILIGLAHGRSELADFGYAQIESVAVECGGRDVADALCGLPRPVVAQLCRRLMPFLAGQAEVDRFDLVLAFAESLGRAHGLSELCSLLRTAADSTDPETARAAAAAWVAADPEAAVELVEADAALAAVPAVMDRLARDRVDVLAEWLSSPGDVAILLRPLSRRIIRRWPPEPRERYLAALGSLALDRRRSASERGMAVKAMSRVAGLRVDDLVSLLGDEHPALSAAALAAIDTASPAERAWGLLMEHAAGPDAAVAGFGLARLAGRLRPGFLAGRIAPLLDSDRLTARTRGVELMLGHRIPGAKTTVRSMWSDDRLPDGLRESIVAGLVHRLDQKWARQIVWESTGFGADVAAPALSAAPFAIAPRHHVEYANFLADAATSGDERLVEVALLNLGRWARHSRRGNGALVDLAADLDGTAHWRAALTALLALAADGSEWGPLLETVRRLRSDRRVEPNATAERDSPVRQRLTQVVEHLKSPLNHRTAALSIPDALIRLLPADLGTQLIVATIHWDAGVDELQALTARIGDPVEAFELGRELERRIWTGRSSELLSFFERLTSTGVLHACVMAAAAIGAPGVRAGWTPEWRELLRRLRAYPAPEVSRLARGVYTTFE